MTIRLAAPIAHTILISALLWIVSPLDGDAATLRPNENYVAIIIGIEKYRDAPAVEFAVSDAELIRERAMQSMGFPEENIILLTNERASKNDLLKWIEGWLPLNTNVKSRVLFYFAGHGAPDPEKGDAYLLPYDGDPAFLSETGYPLSRLYEALNKVPAKNVVVLLDSCFSGSGGRSVIARGARPLVTVNDAPIPPGSKLVVLTAASGSQITGFHERQRHGLFTYYLSEAIQGSSDADGDRWVTAEEAYRYLKGRIEKQARRQGREQSPQFMGENTAIRIARSPAAPRPAESKPNLRTPEADSSNMSENQIVHGQDEPSQTLQRSSKFATYSLAIANRPLLSPEKVMEIQLFSGVDQYEFRTESDLWSAYSYTAAPKIAYVFTQNARGGLSYEYELLKTTSLTEDPQTTTQQLSGDLDYQFLRDERTKLFATLGGMGGTVLSSQIPTVYFGSLSMNLKKTMYPVSFQPAASFRLDSGILGSGVRTWFVAALLVGFQASPRIQIGVHSQYDRMTDYSELGLKPIAVFSLGKQLDVAAGFRFPVWNSTGPPRTIMSSSLGVQGRF